MTAVLLCPRCTQSLPGDAVFCRRCGMSMGAMTAKPPAMRSPVNPPPSFAPRPFRTGIGAGLMGSIFLAGFAFLLFSTHHRVYRTQQQTWPAPVVGPGLTSSGGWSPVLPPVATPATPSVPLTQTPTVQVIPVVPYQVPPPTVYRAEPTVPYQPMPERAYTRERGR